MAQPRKIPRDPLRFIRRCVRQRKIFWTYHVNMRIGQRPLTRDMIVTAIDSFEVIEQYPKDKYLPSYLIRAEEEALVFHVHIATDVAENNVRIVTAYIPDPSEWDKELRKRRRQS